MARGVLLSWHVTEDRMVRTTGTVSRAAESTHVPARLGAPERS